MKDETILAWFFTSIRQIQNESTQSDSVLASLDVVEKITYLFSLSESDTNANKIIIYEILQLLECYVLSNESGYFANVLDSMNNVIKYLGGKHLEERSTMLLNKIVDDLLKLVVSNSSKLNDLVNVNKCSQIFKEFAYK